MEEINWDLIKSIIEILIILLGGSGAIIFLKTKNTKKNKQSITGNGNNQAGRDINNVSGK